MVKRSVLEKKSDDELLKYIQPSSRYTYEAIGMAYDILQKRGYKFSDEEMQTSKRTIVNGRERNEEYVKSNMWDINAVNKNSEYNFYSQKSIWFFSIIFGVHVGAILMAINLRGVLKNQKALIIIIFGLLYSLITYLLYNLSQNYIPKYSGLLYIILTGIGGTLLQVYFWDKFLKGVKYIKKEVYVPFIICLVIYLLIYIARSLI